jgi:hypothetical protein
MKGHPRCRRFCRAKRQFDELVPSQGALGRLISEPAGWYPDLESRRVATRCFRSSRDGHVDLDALRRLDRGRYGVLREARETAGKGDMEAIDNPPGGLTPGTG